MILKCSFKMPKNFIRKMKELSEERTSNGAGCLITKESEVIMEKKRISWEDGQSTYMMTREMSSSV